MIGPLVFCLLAWSIYRQLLRQPDWEVSLLHIKKAFTKASLWKLVLAMLLMFVNWGIEARKWQLAIQRVQPISFLQSFKAIFTGTTMAFFTPNRIGEYMGRILYVEGKNRTQAISLTIVCSIAQLLVTLVAGIGALLYMKTVIAAQGPTQPSLLFWMNTLLYCTIAGTVVLTLFYFRLAWVVRWIEKIPKIERFARHIRVLDSFNATILLRTLSLSVARYLVFIAQYYLLFAVFEVSLNPVQVFGSIGVVFLVLAVVPTIAVITELGVRWKASIEVVQFFSTNLWGVMATSLSIWIINLVLPALIGSLLILGIRIFKNSQAQENRTKSD